MMIELNNLSYRYAANQFQFSLQLAAAEMSVILGPSGAGKSTLLGLIAGFILPDSGDIWLNQIPCHQLTPAQRPISMLFQDNNLFPHLTVFQNIALGLNPSLRLSQTQQQTLTDIAAEMQITPFLMRYPEALSGGQRQRVALARCFIRQQPILLLDEPFAALDPRSRQEMMELLYKLCRERGTTLLMVSHQVDEALNWVERAIVIDHGAILFDGSVNNLRHSANKITTLLGINPLSR